ncbi:MAG: hypothetical protein Q8Q73_13920 [Stagnimonas sp.]|nr:hypothetical protein [Stagnimonas sp.]
MDAKHSGPWLYWLAGLLMTVLAFGARAETYAVDWPAELARAESQPERFAVARAVHIDARGDGHWSRDGLQAVWRIELQVPGARSLSFHASSLQLPADASLSYGGRRISAADLDGADYWSSAESGEQLNLELRLPLTATAAFELRIDQLQAGFRDPQAAPVAAKSADTCTINFSCSARNDALLWGQSVVAITVLNAISCTATLVNNSNQDGRPYLLTASHCRKLNGVLADAQQAAASMRVYWNAVTACDSALAEVGSAAQQISSGAEHRAEASDVWLVELKAPPPTGANPYWAGIDASDQPASGELTGIHHGGRLARQIAWSRGGLQSMLVSVPLLGALPIWEVFAELGAAASGSSGSALFASGGRVVGVLSLSSSCESDPMPSLYYSRLGPAWNGNGSSAGSLRPWLDPANLGNQIPPKAASGASSSGSGGSTISYSAPADAGGGGGGLGLAALLPLLLGAWRRLAMNKAV